MAFSLANAVPAEDPAVAPAAAPRGFSLANAEPVPEKPAAIGPEGLLNYVKDFAGGVKDAVFNPNPHEGEGLANVPGVGVGEAALSMVSQIPAALGLGEIQTGAKRRFEDPNYPLAQGIADMTYSPKTTGGAQLNDVAGALFKPVGDIAHAGGQLLAKGAKALGVGERGQADIATIGDTVLPNVVGLEGLARGKAALPEGPPRPADTVGAFGDPVQQARDMGYLRLPSEVKGSSMLNKPGTEGAVGGVIRESLFGPDLAQTFTVKNQLTTDHWAARDLNLGPDTPLNGMNLEMAKGQPMQTYRRVADTVRQVDLDPEFMQDVQALGARRRNNPVLENTPMVERLRALMMDVGKMTGQQALDAISELRDDARMAFQSLEDPAKKRQEAAAYRDAAGAIESALERSAARSGLADPGLLAEYRGARQQFAKINDYQDALVGDHVDATRLATLGEDKPLSGAAAHIANQATHFPTTMGSGVGVRITPPQMTSMFAAPKYFLRRQAAEQALPYLGTESFQSNFGPRNPGYDPFAPPEPPPTPPPAPAGPTLGAGSVEFTPSNDVQPGRSVGMSDHYGVDSLNPDLAGQLVGPRQEGPGRLWNDPNGTANPWPEVPGPNGPSGSPLEGPQTPPGFVPDQPIQGPPENVPSLQDLVRSVKGNDTVPWNSDLSTFLTELLGPAESPRTVESGLPNNQNLADLGPPRPALPEDPLAGLADLLAGIPEGPPRPIAPQRQPGAASGQSIADALSAQDVPNTPAAPTEFPTTGTVDQSVRTRQATPSPSSGGTFPRTPKALDELMLSEPQARPETVDLSAIKDQPDAHTAAANVRSGYDALQQQMDRYPIPKNAPGGKAVTETLYRGTDEKNAGGNATGGVSYSPSESVAKRYGEVTKHTIQFKNLLESPTYEELPSILGLPKDAGYHDLIQRAQLMGYDGLKYTLRGGEVEYIHIPRE